MNLFSFSNRDLQNMLTLLRMSNGLSVKDIISAVEKQVNLNMRNFHDTAAAKIKNEVKRCPDCGNIMSFGTLQDSGDILEIIFCKKCKKSMLYNSTTK